MRQKKDAKYLNVYIEKSIYDRFAELCEQLGQSKTVGAERALKRYIEAMSPYVDAPADFDSKK